MTPPAVRAARLAWGVLCYMCVALHCVFKRGETMCGKLYGYTTTAVESLVLLASCSMLIGEDFSPPLLY